MVVRSTAEKRPATHPLRLSPTQQSLLDEVWLEIAKLKEYSPQLPDASLNAFMKLKTALTNFERDYKALLNPWLDNAMFDDSVDSEDNQDLSNVNGMEAIVETLGALYGVFVAEKDDEAPGDRIQRIYKAGQKADGKVQEILGVDKLQAAETKASTEAGTGNDTSFQLTEKSGDTDPSIQPTKQPADTSQQSAKSANDLPVSIGDLLGGIQHM
jgi:hypothetical protein